MRPEAAPDQPLDEELIRGLIPSTTGVLVRRGVDFAAAEDAVQEALLAALRRWPEDPPADPQGWLITAAWHRAVDVARSELARRRREERVDAEPAPGPSAAQDDTLQMYFLCAHPSLSASAAVALTLRAVGGLTTRQIAEAHLVPESTMAQRISRAKRRITEVSFDQPGDLGTVLRVLHLVFTAGHSGDLDLAEEAIRLTRRLAAVVVDEELGGLLALMLLHQARRPARFDADGSLVPLAEQDRRIWDSGMITEGVGLLQAALARDRLGEYQVQAAIAACTRMRPAPRRPTGRRSWNGTTSWCD